MLVRVKIIKGEEISVNLPETATVAELKEELSNLLSRPISQIKLLKTSGGVLLASARVTDIYTHPTPLKVILGQDLSPKQEQISLKIKLLNTLSESFITLPSLTLLSSLKEKVSEMLGLTRSSLTFLHDGLALTKDSFSLKDLKIRNGATVIVKQLKQTKKLLVKFHVPNSVDFQLSFSLCTSLSELRKLVASTLQKNVDTIILVKSEVTLTDDSKSLRDYNMEDGCIIHVKFNTESSNSDSSSATKENSSDELKHPFFSEMDTVLTKHIPDASERVRVMEHFSQHTTTYVNSLNLEDIEEIACSRNPPN